MNILKTTKNNNLKLYLTVGGLGVAIFGASFYLLRKLKNKTPSHQVKCLPKETVLKILRETKREQYPIITELAQTCLVILAEADNVSMHQEIKNEVFAASKFVFHLS